MVSSNPQYRPGDIVLTKYGVVVITHIVPHKNEEGCDVDPTQFTGRMWRIPELSIASSSTCTLQFDTVSFAQ